MKKIFKTGVFAMFLLGMVSCGGSVDSGVVGEWTPEYLLWRLISVMKFQECTDQ